MSRDFFIGFSNQNVTPSKVVVFLMRSVDRIGLRIIYPKRRWTQGWTPTIVIHGVITPLIGVITPITHV